MKLVSYLNKEYKSVFGILDSKKIYPLSNCNTFVECIDFLKNKTLDNILNKSIEGYLSIPNHIPCVIFPLSPNFNSG